MQEDQLEEDNFDEIFEDDTEVEEPTKVEETPAEDAAKETEEAATEATEAETKTDEAGAEKPAEETAVVETVEDEPPKGGSMIPQTAFTAMREDLKGQITSRDDRIASLEQRLAQQAQPQPAAQSAPQNEDIPDPILDPQGFAKWQSGQMQAMVQNTMFEQRMQTSYNAELANGKTEADLKQEATAFMSAAQADKRLVDGMKASHDPIAYIRNWNTQQAAQAELAAYGGDIAAYTAAKIAEAQGVAPATSAPATPTAAKPAPVIPQSIVNTRPADKALTTGAPDQDDFEAIFS